MNMPLTKFTDLLSARTLLIIAPIFLLTHKHWINLMVVLAFLAAITHLIRNRHTAQAFGESILSWRRWLCWSLAGSFAAIGIGQLLRQDFYAPNFDSPLRMLLCVPVFMAISQGWVYAHDQKSVTQTWTTLSFPLTLIWTALDRGSHTTAWGDSVITTHFVDPLSFGSLTLLLSLLSFAGLTFYWQQLRAASRLITVLGIFCGFYLAIMSGSRTGWANMPVFFLIWTLFFGSKKWGLKKSLLLCISTTLLVAIGVYANPFILKKINLIFSEISNYHWSEMNEDGSVTLRISFYRMAVHYILANPIVGWGDLGWMARMNDPELLVYASEFARDFPRNGFHNEILTKTVRSGIWGLLSSLAFFLLPMQWAIRQIRSQTKDAPRHQALFILFFMLHLLIAGMTTEVTNLIFLGSFIGITMAVLLGESLYIAEKAPSSPLKTSGAKVISRLD